MSVFPVSIKKFWGKVPEISHHYCSNEQNKFSQPANFGIIVKFNKLHQLRQTNHHKFNMKPKQV